MCIPLRVSELSLIPRKSSYKYYLHAFYRIMTQLKSLTSLHQHCGMTVNWDFIITISSSTAKNAGRYLSYN